MKDNVLRKFNFALHSLKLIGHFESPVLSTLYGFTFITSSIVLVFGGIIGFFNYPKLYHRLDIFCCCVCVACAAILFVSLNGNLIVLTHFLTSISQDQSIDGDLRIEALQLTIEKAEATIPKFFVIVIFLVQIEIVGVCSILFLPEIDYHNKNYYIFPDLFQCPDDGVNRFTGQFLCTKRETFLNFFLTNLIVVLYFTWAAGVCFLWPFAFLLCFRIFIDANISVIKKALLQVGDNSERIGILADFTARNQLKKVIRYHQYLFR